MTHAVITGDIIASTSMKVEGREKLEAGFEEIMEKLKEQYNVTYKIFKGDYLECYIPEIEKALRVLLIIKTGTRALDINETYARENDNRFKVFKQYGIKLAIGIGTLDRMNIEDAVFDGEAIYNAGRTISEQKTYNKRKIIVKRTLYFKSSNELQNQLYDPILYILDTLINKCTAKQCEIIWLKLLGNDDASIARLSGRAQSSVSQHATAAGWNAIHKVVQWYEKTYVSYMG